MARGIIYCRESRTQKGSDSLDDQEKLCREFCRRNKIRAKVAYKEPNSSARFMKNGKKLDSIINNLRAGDILVVARVDRLSRHYLKGLGFLRYLKNNDINVYSAEEDINFKDNFGKFQKLLKKAEDFSNDMSDKMKCIIKSLTRKGWHFGQPPYGYKVTYDANNIRKIKKYDQEQDVLTFIKNCISKGDTYETISKNLNRLKIRYRKKFWNEKNVSYVVRRHKEQIKKLYQLV